MEDQSIDRNQKYQKLQEALMRALQVRKAGSDTFYIEQAVEILQRAVRATKEKVGEQSPLLDEWSKHLRNTVYDIDPEKYLNDIFRGLYQAHIVQHSIDNNSLNQIDILTDFINQGTAEFIALNSSK